MSVYSLASRLNSVQIEVKSKVSKNNPAFTGTISSTGAISAAGNYTTTSGNITNNKREHHSNKRVSQGRNNNINR